MPELKQRTCGSCTACCKSLEVVELKKSPNKWCVHCDIGKGCKIYATKPASCSEFRCEWMKGNMREEHRPDKTMVILDYLVLPDSLPRGILQIWEVSEGRLKSDYVMETTRHILGEGVWVSHLPIHGRRKMFVPKGGVLDEDIVAALRKENFEIVEFSP